MNIYSNALRVQEILLRKSGKESWANWLAEDIEEWHNKGTTIHHKSAYGGMGSINDLFIGSISAEGFWTQEMFEKLMGISHEFASAKQIDLRENLCHKDDPALTGSHCSKCKHAEVTTLELESWIASIQVPIFILSLLSSADSEKLADIKTLISAQEVNMFRKAIENKLTESGILLNRERRTRMKPCPVCNDLNTGVQEWKITETDTGFDIG